MYLIRFLLRGLIVALALILFFTFSPISFPEIRIEKIEPAPPRTALGEDALPIDYITRTSLPQPTQTAVPAPTAIPDDSVEMPEAAHVVLDVAKVEGAWRDWMTRHKIKKSAMAIGAQGLIAHRANAGRDADTAYPVASLSKAATAMCLNALLANTGHNWDTPLSEMTTIWKRLGMYPHPALGELPLSALVTHTSGFPKNIDADETAGEGRNLYTQIHFARSALRNPEHLGKSRRHLYSNVNFAILGQIIEGISGQPYGDICRETIMTPAGAADARVGGRMWATAGFGGWSVSASDYARFLMHWYAPRRPWVADPHDYPLDTKSGAGLGVFNQNAKSHHLLYHSGLWRSKKAERRIGALFLTSDTGTVFVANWRGSLPSKAYSDLRQSITDALH